MASRSDGPACSEVTSAATSASVRGRLRAPRAVEEVSGKNCPRHGLSSTRALRSACFLRPSQRYERAALPLRRWGSHWKPAAIIPP